MFSWFNSTPQNEENESFGSKISSVAQSFYQMTNEWAKQHEKEQQEILSMEQRRCDNFKMHVELIDLAKTMLFNELLGMLTRLAPLREPAQRFGESKHQGFPETKQGDNIFKAILSNKGLLEQEVLEIFDILFDKLDYTRYQAKLLAEPLVNVLLTDKRLYQLLYERYVYHLRFGFESDMTESVERRIWGNFLDFQSIENLDQIWKLLKSEIFHVNKPIKYLIQWIQFGKTSSEVMAIYDHLHSKNNKRSDNAKDINHLLLKIAKQRILAIEIENIKKHQPISNPAKTIDFLDFSFSKFHCFHQTASRKIYEKILENNSKALKDYENEQKKIDKKFYKKYNLSS